ncbi:MAG: N-acetyltransferase [Desulfobacterium sp.]|nr:N-acetyltransferase [Desulfobacterium sp.]
MITFSILKSPSPDQIEKIINLYRQAGWWKNSSDNPELVTRIIHGSHCFMVVSTKDGIIGMGRAISDGASDAYIQDVMVDKSFQGQKIGSSIIQKLVEQLRTDGLTWIGLIAENNSQQFYENLGFTKMKNATPMLNLLS